ncbi:hypothetical protein K469DRAFT_703857 [Zopfia rhizophila CBS 207.26]|uniref:Rhodopsin domain-containing protein n=1 Tax=Zopfia rhizophila CBS 207.26 TaxID=1314779 RepID=A0A6A6EAZ2_9PEZI|nr:hypothetical protein K469DRAFT_703857 [Zopfia rhizophila CBS 207.26]
MDQRLPPVTRGESLNVLSWTLLCLTILSKVARFGTKYVIVRKWEWDDLLAILALVFSASQTIAMSMETASGLGLHFSTLSATEKIAFQKASYSSGILFIATLWASKTATVLLVQQLNAFSWELQLARGTAVLLGGWAFTAIFASAFACSLPRPWKLVGNRCFDRAAFYNYVSISNIITEVIVLVVPMIVLWKINITKKRKAAILSCFGSRIFTIIAMICQLVYGQKAYSTSDPTFDKWKTAMCAQLVQNLCVISCSIPYLKPFYIGLQSGMIRSDDLRRGHTSGYATGSGRSEGYERDSENEGAPSGGETGGR